MMYRLYANGDVFMEDDFTEKDSSSPYYDDFELIYVPDDVVEYIRIEAEGK